MEQIFIILVVAGALLFIARRVYHQITKGDSHNKCDACPISELAKFPDSAR